MATTANTIIDAAYRKIGISSPTSVEDEYALEALNNMVSLWGTEFITPSIVGEDFALIVAQSEYTIGTGGDFATDRPLSIANAFIRDAVLSTDTSLKIVSGKEFSAITDKAESGVPSRVYYDATYPLGSIYLDRAPDAIDQIYFEFWKNFTEFALLTTTVDLPNEYKKALIYNLAVELAEDNSIELPPSVYRAADLSQILIARMVAANRIPGKSEFPVHTGGIPQVGQVPTR